jgi:hypothetical protein
LLHATKSSVILKKGNQQAATRPRKGKREWGREKINLGDGREVVVLDHVAQHDEHGEGEEARHDLPRVDRH